MKVIAHQDEPVNQKLVFPPITVQCVDEKASHPLGLKDRSAARGARADKISTGAERCTVWWRLGNCSLRSSQRHFAAKPCTQSQQKHGRKSVTGEQALSGTCANLADILGGMAEAL
jgi:hypothetical protein